MIARVLRIGSLAVFLGLMVRTPAAFAAAPKLSSAVWHAGDTITVTGDDLQGVYVRLRKLCFAPEARADDLTCFGAYDPATKEWVYDDDPYLKRWDRTTLSFTVPESVPARGILKLLLFGEEQTCFGSAGCVDSPVQDDVVIGSFRTVPRIDAVLDAENGKPATSIQKGKRYRIEGTLFGTEPGSVSVAELGSTTGAQGSISWTLIDATAIEGWNYDGIAFTASASAGSPAALRVNNSGHDSNAFQLAGSASSASASAGSSSVGQGAASSASPAGPPFSDVPADDAYAPAIRWARQTGLVGGYPDGTFQPDRPVNRAELLKIVFSALGTEAPGTGTDPSPFVDVDTGAWFAPFVTAAKRTGIVGGYPDGTFQPARTVSFAEGLKIAYRALHIPFDEQVGGPWYEPYLRHALSHQVLKDAGVDLAGGMSRKDVVWVAWKLWPLRNP